MEGERLRLVSVSVAGAAAAGVSVVLSDGPHELAGAAAGLPGAIEETAARATLRAVEAISGRGMRLLAAALAPLGDVDVALVSVGVGGDRMIGVATVGLRTVPEAFARASLDAVNRILSGSADDIRRRRHEIVYRDVGPPPSDGGSDPPEEGVADEPRID